MDIDCEVLELLSAIFTSAVRTLPLLFGAIARLTLLSFNPLVGQLCTLIQSKSAGIDT